MSAHQQMLVEMSDQHSSISHNQAAMLQHKQLHAVAMDSDCHEALTDSTQLESFGHPQAEAKADSRIMQHGDLSSCIIKCMTACASTTALLSPMDMTLYLQHTELTYNLHLANFKSHIEFPEIRPPHTFHS